MPHLLFLFSLVVSADMSVSLLMCLRQCYAMNFLLTGSCLISAPGYQSTRLCSAQHQVTVSFSCTRRGCRGGRSAKRAHTLKCFIHIGLINAGSVNSKSAVITNFLASNDFDVLAITETWLTVERGDDDLRLLCPDGFNVFHLPRVGITGGGVAVLVRDSIDRYYICFPRHCAEIF